jgi:hypothetical protein
VVNKTAMHRPTCTSMSSFYKHFNYLHNEDKILWTWSKATTNQIKSCVYVLRVSCVYVLRVSCVYVLRVSCVYVLRVSCVYVLRVSCVYVLRV